MTTNSTTRINRDARLRWVPIAKTKINTLAQRDFNKARAEHIATTLDLEQIGTPTVSLRDDAYYIIDGQHRIEALKIHGWGDQQIQCWVYEGLTSEEEAERFLKLNDTLALLALPKFRAAVHAGRDVETEIDRVVRAQDLCISQDKIPGAIRAVGTLRRVHKLGGSKTLGRSLRIIRDAYGDAGLEAPVISGIGLLCHRYNGSLDDEKAVDRLGNQHGGVNGLLNEAEKLRLKTGNQKAQCVAAAAVEQINRGRGGKKLPSWWKDEAA